MEFFGAFYLVFTVYAAAVHRKASPGACALLIGISLSLGIAAFGRVTGGALNPARTFGPSMVGGEFMMRGWWIYYLGPFAGGVTAALLYKYMFEGSDGQYDSVPSNELEG